MTKGLGIRHRISGVSARWRHSFAGMNNAFGTNLITEEVVKNSGRKTSWVCLLFVKIAVYERGI